MLRQRRKAQRDRLAPFDRECQRTKHERRVPPAQQAIKQRNRIVTPRQKREREKHKQPNLDERNPDREQTILDDGMRDIDDEDRDAGAKKRRNL